MDIKLSITDLVNEVAEVHGLDRQRTELFVRSFVDIISENIITDKIVKIKGFGTFKLIDVQDRESVDVNTGERIRIAGHGKITFTPDNSLKDAVNRPFSEFDTVILNDGVDMAMMENTDEGQNELETVEEPESSTVPEVPESPETPETPVVTETPVVPEAPESPVIPETPEVPETPDVPESPVVPETPEVPEAPVVPETKPVTPEPQPVTPEPQPVKSEPQKSVSTQSVGSQHVEELNVGTQHVEHQTIQQIANTTDRGRAGIHLSVGGIIASIIIILLLMAGSFYLGTLHPQIQQKTVQTEPVTKPASKPAVKPTPKPTVEPVSKPADKPVDKPTAKPADKPTEKPADKPTEKPADKPKVKPADKPAATPQPKASEPTPEQLAKKYPQVVGGEYWIVGQMCTHEMLAGENLYRISRKELGSKELIQYLIVMNGFDSPDVIPVGYKIKIPKLVKKQK